LLFKFGDEFPGLYIVCCLASSSGRRSHFIVKIINEQSVQVCDATEA